MPVDLSGYVIKPKVENAEPIASAAAVADRFPHPCTWMSGWWRTRAVCHDSDGPHTLAFRDPEREGASLAVHCHQPACAADHDGVRHAIQKATGLRVCACPQCQGKEFPNPPPMRKKQVSNGKTKKPRATPVLPSHWGGHTFTPNWLGNPAQATSCPACGQDKAVLAEAIHPHPFPYLTLTCICGCDLPYDTLHKHVIARLPSELSWRQEAHYWLADGAPRPHLRFDSGSRPKLQYWSNGEKCEHAGRPVKGLSLLRWAREPLAAQGNVSIVVEGEKAAAAIASAGLDWLYRVFSAGSAAALENCEFSAMTGNETLLWPDNDEAGLKGMAALGNRLAADGASVSVVDLKQVPAKQDAADLPPSLINTLVDNRIRKT